MIKSKFNQALKLMIREQSKKWLWLLFVTSLTNTMNVSACPARIYRPIPEEPERYSHVIETEVLDVTFPPSIFSVSDLTPPYEVKFRLKRTVVGEDFRGDSLRIEAGCAIPIPRVGDIGLFFIELRYKRVAPLYDRRGGRRINAAITTIENALRIEQ